MSEHWIRCSLTAELTSDAHLGSGAGGCGVDALISRDRSGRPVIWASHLEGVLRDAARRLRDDEFAGEFFGRAGGERQRAVFTSLYAQTGGTTHVWRSAARASFQNRAPKDDTLRVVEHAPMGTRFSGQVELPESQLPVLRRLVQEVDALGSGRATGAGRVTLTLSEVNVPLCSNRKSTGRLVLLLRNLDPVCITATATPDNLIPSLAFVPGRAVLGAMTAWLIAENEREVAALLVGGNVSVSDALPLPKLPQHLESTEVLPAPLSLQRPKPEGSAGRLPWWAHSSSRARRLDAWGSEAERAKALGEKLKRPEDNLFVFRAGEGDWIAFRPSLRVRLRNGRERPNQPDPGLFAIEQIVEGTHFLCELTGSPDHMARIANKLAPILSGSRWLRIGRSGAPFEVVRLAWSGEPCPARIGTTARLTLTSDLLIRDQYLRWITSLDEASLRLLPRWPEEVQIARDPYGRPMAVQDCVPVHGFNGTSRLWRMPAAAIRRGSVFQVVGPGVVQLAIMAARGMWLGERVHEGFGRFRLDTELPGVTDDNLAHTSRGAVEDAKEETIAATTKRWLDAHRELVKPANREHCRPSLSQWFELVAELDRNDPDAIDKRLGRPNTLGARGWMHEDARSILEMLKQLASIPEQAAHARLFVRWLRSVTRTETVKGER